MAKQLFDAYPPVPNRRAWAIHAAYYSANLILYYLQGKDFPAAQRELQRMEEAMKSPKLRKKYREEAEKIFAERRMFVQVHMGNYDGAEEVYLREVREAKDLLAAVSASCLLVKIYAATGEPAKAAERYAFVRDKGGDTRYAEEARQYLAQAIPE
ncbi:MAG: hypothetical protein LBM28_03445 [Oscillospiraceae bacterium]|nr:hypothetical protein [Oscillospiraceae bacterium]